MTIKIISCLFIASLTLAACTQSPKPEEKTSVVVNDTIAKQDTPEVIDIKDTIEIPTGELFQLMDAEKILGEPAHLEDSSGKMKNGVYHFLSSYKAFNQKKKIRGVIYFLIEKYQSDTAAHSKYSFIKKANEDHGIETIKDLGDEAYFHTDKKNFYFIMVRKGSQVFNLKVNKLTEYTSLEDFYEVAHEITDKLK